jgi:hypothetical protein
LTRKCPEFRKKAEKRDASLFFGCPSSSVPKPPVLQRAQMWCDVLFPLGKKDDARHDRQATGNPDLGQLTQNRQVSIHGLVPLTG